ncbi:hypothetical protein Y717_34585, partial [Streptomyces scopuliridis RB72]
MTAIERDRAREDRAWAVASRVPEAPGTGCPATTDTRPAPETAAAPYAPDSGTGGAEGPQAPPGAEAPYGPVGADTRPGPGTGGTGGLRQVP